ncbi:class I SAM-dependent methyltransferase [Bradyrhizobium sp. Rc2d]|uniref:class I SAM-dependent methyltransferase n=1 Tax=Bradyrhizobium sp. Rc2d TaxID=1855321 RepID=UPI000B82A1DE|nr:class I SAM-dependent methyltransferase [Bradyrhizobium sp. Rc2d]
MPLLVPSKLLLQFLDRFTSSYDKPILDAPCGFGRNAFSIAARGYDVIACDKDTDRLRSLTETERRHTKQLAGRISVVAADLAAGKLPFAQSSFSAILCIHYPVQHFISDLDAVLKGGGHIYIETFRGHGGNHLELPKAGEVRHALEGYKLLF